MSDGFFVGVLAVLGILGCTVAYISTPPEQYQSKIEMKGTN